MGKFAVGEVVLVSFPFSNLQGQKVRPALVLAKAGLDDLILCQITSKPYTSKLAVRIRLDDFTKGSLPVVSYARPNKLFTANSSIIKKTAGQLTPVMTKSILKSVRSLFTL
ncbi:type II toxin-antitoxin system PemK/MazF family toxin [Candidatus Curtissbacteria bacterium]|nr:type II toxin-antitoxin system PemK/MazF family toxin [Candidatus Curtissbacteria bacterium]